MNNRLAALRSFILQNTLAQAVGSQYLRLLIFRYLNQWRMQSHIGGSLPVSLADGGEEAAGDGGGGKAAGGGGVLGFAVEGVL